MKLQQLENIESILTMHVEQADDAGQPIPHDVKVDLVCQIKALAARLPMSPTLDENSDLLTVFSNLVLIAATNPEMIDP